MRFLIADDFEDFRDLLGGLLKTLYPSAQVVFAEDGAQVLEILEKKTNFDIIICDYHMPKMNGLEVFGAMCELGLNIPFILFSAISVPESALFMHPRFLGRVDKHDIEALKSLVQKSATPTSPK